jgi:hypothetical protein
LVHHEIDPVPVQEPPQKRKKRVITFGPVTVSVEGENHTIQNVPSTHTVLHNTELSKLKACKEQVAAVRAKVRRGCYAGSLKARSYLVVALAFCPALALSTAAVLLPLICFFLLEDTGILDGIATEEICASFPSHQTLRTMLFDYAAEKLVELGKKLKDIPYTYLSCDKGNKKGVSHFVKVLSWWDPILKKVRTFILDIDASEGSSEGCADAIKHSLKKVVSFGAIQYLIQGLSTDSGGGGVIDGLALCLDKIG